MDKRTLERSPGRRHSWLWRVAGGAIVSSLLISLSSCFNKVIFEPPKASYGPDSDVLWVPTADGLRIAAMYYPRPGAEFTILYSHGNNEDIGQHRAFCRLLNRWGYSVFAYDYHGYGLSQGHPTEHNAYLDIGAAYAYLVGTLRAEPNSIIALGRSVGSGPTVQLATQKPLAGIVLQSGFASAFRVVTRAEVLPGDEFVNIDKMAEVYCPVLVVHGTADRVVPIWHGRKLCEAAHEPKRCLWVEGAGHDDFAEVADGRYREALEEFTQVIRGWQGR